MGIGHPLGKAPSTSNPVGLSSRWDLSKHCSYIPCQRCPLNGCMPLLCARTLSSKYFLQHAKFCKLGKIALIFPSFSWDIFSQKHELICCAKWTDFQEWNLREIMVFNNIKQCARRKYASIFLKLNCFSNICTVWHPQVSQLAAKLSN